MTVKELIEHLQTFPEYFEVNIEHRNTKTEYDINNLRIKRYKYSPAPEYVTIEIY